MINTKNKCTVTFNVNDIVSSSRLCAVSSIEASRADLGVGRGGPGHPFFFFYYSYRILRKKESIYKAGKCPGHLSLNFLDPSLGLIIKLPESCVLESVQAKLLAEKFWTIRSTFSSNTLEVDLRLYKIRISLEQNLGKSCCCCFLLLFSRFLTDTGREKKMNWIKLASLAVPADKGHEEYQEVSSSKERQNLPKQSFSSSS